MIASSAARSLLSVSSRFVSSNRRAFSRATPMLAASVESSLSSPSLNASFDSSETDSTPKTRSPVRIGAAR
jgi:hypothetical protein